MRSSPMKSPKQLVVLGEVRFRLKKFYKIKKRLLRHGRQRRRLRRRRREIKLGDRFDREQGQRGFHALTLLHFYDPMVINVSPNKLAPDSMVGVSVLVDRFCVAIKKVVEDMLNEIYCHHIYLILWKHYHCLISQGAVLVKNLAAKEPSVLGQDTYYKQYYLCLAAAAATNNVQNLEIIKQLHSILWGTKEQKGNLLQMRVMNKVQNYTGNYMYTSTEAQTCIYVHKHTGTNIDYGANLIKMTRLLQANLLQPFKDIETINARLHRLTWFTRVFRIGLHKHSQIAQPKTTMVICRTRLLRANLLQPLKDIETINARFNCLVSVKEAFLMKHHSPFFSLQLTSINHSELVSPKPQQDTFNGSSDHMNIDATWYHVQNLEIIEPLHSNLWGTMNKKEVYPNEEYYYARKNVTQWDPCITLPMVMMYNMHTPLHTLGRNGLFLLQDQSSTSQSIASSQRYRDYQCTF
ncbi:hypothetical protein RJ641_035317 [Dillenia turbinata]|uniref:Uncharacterized protein n=1 Tax=Dillenia turbinata TaxID=194707 RepID=A0AAN8ZET8_9MAGN